ncbi:MAG TPA: response regulator [Cyclobacteriaceae bacterium]|nr:response regulator [Cyclobacteriaceae bacterium]
MIYIIEDDMSVRRSFEFFLESEGLAFKSFGSAESFLSGAKPLMIDLLLLDVNLPAMDGLELLDKLAEENKMIPAIVISALDNAHTRERCRRQGVKAFLRKPVDGQTLVDLIKYHSNH